MSAVPESTPLPQDPDDLDPLETREWLDALEAVIER
jgi:pyruvate dehydrogenase complex dehydrogenase (E1) component